MNSVEYLIDIQAKMSAGNTVSQLTDIERKMKAEQSTIQNLEAAMRRLGNSSRTDAAKMARIGAAAEASRGRLAGLADSYASLGSKGAGALAKPAQEAPKMSALLTVVAQRFGLSAEEAQKFGKAASVALGTFAAVKVVGAAIGIFEKLTGAVLNYGRSLVELGMHELDRAANAKITYEAYSRSASVAEAADRRVRSLADTYGVAEKDLSGYAVALLKAGIRGEDFNDGMQAAAIRAAAFGAEAVNMEDIVGRGADGMKGYARAMELAYGATALKRGQTYEAGIERIKRKLGDLMASPALQGGLSNLFGKIESWLGSPKGAAFFDKIAEAAGKAMDALSDFIGSSDFDSLTNDIADFARSAAELAPKILPTLSSIADSLFKIADAVTKVIGLFEDLADPGGLGRKNKALHREQQNQTDEARAAREALGQEAFDKSGGSGTKAGKVVHAFNDAIREGKSVEEATAAGRAAGEALGLGMAQGITSSTTMVTDAAAAMSAEATEAVRGALEIHSPSRVFAELGRYTAQGFAGGVDDEAPGAESALARMATPPNVVRNGGSGRSITVTIGDIVGVENAEHAAQLFEEKLASVLEGLALEDGAGA